MSELPELRRECSAGGVVVYGGRILIMRNRLQQWVFPKGGVEHGESLEEAALREVREETGLRTEIVKKIGETKYTYLSGNVPCEKTVHWFLMQAADPYLELCRREGFIEAIFAPLEDAHTLLVHDNDRALLEIVVAWMLDEEEPSHHEAS